MSDSTASRQASPWFTPILARTLSSAAAATPVGTRCASCASQPAGELRFHRTTTHCCRPSPETETRVTIIRRIYAYLLAFAGLTLLSIAAASLGQLLLDVALRPPR